MDKSVKTSKKIYEHLGKTNEQVQVQDFSSKMQPLTYFSSHMRQIARQSDPGSYFFRPLTKEFLPNDAAPGISATLAKTIHSVHVSIYIYMLKCLLIPIYVFFNPALALSTCRFP